MENKSLRLLTEKRGKYIGAAVSVPALKNDPEYGQVLAREFNMVTAENAMKFEPLCPGTDLTYDSRPTRDENNYRFEDAEEIVRFAEKNNMKVRGHTLVWHHQLPKWISLDGMTNDKGWDKGQLEQIMEEHISIVAGRFKGRIYAWDVVNEAVAGDDDREEDVKIIRLPGMDRDIRLRNAVWLQVLGADYLEMAFRLAYEVNPDALLFYNDFNGEGKGRKSDDIFTLVKYLVNRGVPIHGIGIQAHISLDENPSPEDMKWNIQRFIDLGLDVHITELDVRIKGDATEVKLKHQADIYRDMAEVMMSFDKCKALVTWGFTDKYSWVPYGFPGYDNGLLIDRDYNRKPAYQSVYETLKQ